MATSHTCCDVARYLPDIQFGTQHDRLISDSEPPTFGGKQCTFDHMNFCILQGSAVTFFTNNTVEKWLFGFHKVSWLQLTREMGKLISYQCQIFTGLSFSKNKRWSFLRLSVLLLYELRPYYDNLQFRFSEHVENDFSVKYKVRLREALSDDLISVFIHADVLISCLV